MEAGGAAGGKTVTLRLRAEVRLYREEFSQNGC